ncbi:MAG: hypothetical protein ACRBBP_04060 [Bdellovibrionales bacterium]
MKLILVFLTFVMALLGCNSPRNNRVNGGVVQESAVVDQQMFNSAGVKLEVLWVKGPFGTSTKTSEMLVVVTNAEDERVSLKGELGFYAWMPSMGHPGDDMGFFEEIDKGVYLNSGIRFNMGGEWEILLQELDEDFNVKDEVKWLEFL